jgi:hypothetical protein
MINAVNLAKVGYKVFAGAIKIILPEAQHDEFELHVFLPDDLYKDWQMQGALQLNNALLGAKPYQMCYVIGFGFGEHIFAVVINSILAGF